jgi:hypothetical protein
MRSESIDPDVLRQFLARYRAAKGHTLMSLSAKAKASITNSNVRPCSASGASSELQDELIGLGCPPKRGAALRDSPGLLDSGSAKRRQLTEFFAASLAEVSQGIQRTAIHHRAQFWHGLVR